MRKRSINVKLGRAVRASTRCLVLPVLLGLALAGCERPAQEAAAPPPTSGPPPQVLMETSRGTVRMELYPDRAPETVRNFLDYVRKGHYDGTIFHRVIPDFMIQGGGYTPELQLKPTGPGIRNEADNGLRNDRYTMAMARKPDPDSATAQFFINVADNGFLNRDQSQDGYGYTVFGKVVEGMEVVDAIKDVPTTTRQTTEGQPMQDVPVEPVVIRSIRIADSVPGEEEAAGSGSGGKG